MSIGAPAEGVGGQVVGLILQAFGSESNVRLRRAAQAATVGTAVWKLAKQIRARRAASRDFVVTVSQDDGVYGALHGWLLEQMPAEDRRSLAVLTVRTPVGAVEVEEGTGGRRPRLRLLYDGRKVATIQVDGHRVTAVIEQADHGGDEEKMMLRKPSKLIFSATSIEGRDAILAVVDRLATEADERGPRLKMAHYGYWNERSDIPERSLDTVILRAGQREELVADIQRFLDSEDTYARLGLPWHRGYVFHGPPGTGKSSLARALASHFQLDVHFAALSDCKSNNGMLNLIGNVPARSMLLLEDVDVLKAATSREGGGADEGDLSALLNALDGLATPHGLITVMTTNNIDALDEALLRPGRADRIEHIDYLDHDQAERLAALVVGHPVAMPRYVKAKLTAADVMEAAKPWLDRPEMLEDVVIEAVSCERAELDRRAA